MGIKAAGVPSVGNPSLTLWYVEDFLSAADCTFLTEQIEHDRQPSTLLSDIPDQGFRTSDSCNLNRWDERIQAIDRRVCSLMGLGERQPSAPPA